MVEKIIKKIDENNEKIEDHLKELKIFFQNLLKKEKERTNKILNDEILFREVKAFGNSAHIPVPSKHIGKTARIEMIQDKTEGDKEAKKD